MRRSNFKTWVLRIRDPQRLASLWFHSKNHRKRVPSFLRQTHLENLRQHKRLNLQLQVAHMVFLESQDATRQDEPKVKRSRAIVCCWVCLACPQFTSRLFSNFLANPDFQNLECHKGDSILFSSGLLSRKRGPRSNDSQPSKRKVKPNLPASSRSGSKDTGKKATAN